MKTITDSIFKGDDCFILKDSGCELSMENAFVTGINKYSETGNGSAVKMASRMQ